MRFAAHQGLIALIVFTFASVVVATGCGSDTDGTRAGTTGPTTDTLPEWVAKVPLRVEISPPGAWDGAIKEQQAVAAARKRFQGEQPPQKPIAIPVRASGTVELSISVDEAGNEDVQMRTLDRSPAWLVLFPGIEKRYLAPPGCEDENSDVLTDVVVLVDGQTGERLDNLALFGETRLLPD